MEKIEINTTYLVESCNKTQIPGHIHELKCINILGCHAKFENVISGRIFWEPLSSFDRKNTYENDGYYILEAMKHNKPF